MKQTIIFSTLLLLFLTGCGGGKSNNSSDDTQTVKNPYSYGYDCEGDITVNGYTLPPCPDPKINDSTLLGIDSNDNGVRDDVERWLIVKYKNHHRIVTEIGFQTAKAAQEIVKSNPSEAQEVDKIMRKAVDCNYYFESYANLFNDPLLIDHTIITTTAYKTIQFNTEQRIKAYLAYDKALGGGGGI